MEAFTQHQQPTELLLNYLRPLQPILSRACVGEGEEGKAMTNTEFKDHFSLIISFEEAKWICNTLWRNFFQAVQKGAKGEVNKDNFENTINELKTQEIAGKMQLLAESVRYARVAARMVEVDLHEIQNTGNMFTFETQSLDSQGPANQTGLSSEERLIEEAVQINELALMGSMLLSLLKFD